MRGNNKEGKRMVGAARSNHHFSRYTPSLAELSDMPIDV